MTLRDDLLHLEGLHQNIRQANKALETFREKMVEEHCPHKIGDVVVIKAKAERGGPFTYSSHEGKKMEITHIFQADGYTPTLDAMYLVLKGLVLKKDGTIGKNRSEMLVTVKASVK